MRRGSDGPSDDGLGNATDGGAGVPADTPEPAPEATTVGEPGRGTEKPPVAGPSTPAAGEPSSPAPPGPPDPGPEAPSGHGVAAGAEDREVDAEVAELVGKLAEREEMSGTERRRLLGRLSQALRRRAGGSREPGYGRGRWLTEVYMSVAPRIPIRDLVTLSEHHHGLTGEALADDLVRTAAKATMAVGAVGGALAAAEFAAPPLLLSAPAQLVAETLVVAVIETKLIAELHEVYGVRVAGTGAQRALAFAVAWSKQRGVDPLAPGSMTIALGTAAKTALRNRLMRTLGRHLTTLGPFLTGAVAGGTLNSVATRRMAAAVRADLRSRALPPA